MRVEHDMTPAVKAWLKGTKESPHTARETVRSVMERVPETPQRRRRRWSWPSLRRSPAGDPTTTTSGLAPAGGFTMFSALKFVTAGVIVALFSGFLLTGVLTTPATEEVPPAAVTESPSPETTTKNDLHITYEPTDDPAVFRVISEPHRKWLKPGNLGPIAIDHEGGVWVNGVADDDDRRFVVQVGVPGRTRFAKMGEFFYTIDELEFSGDGTLWGASDRMRLRSLDGGTWKVHPIPAGITAVTEVPDEHAGKEDYGILDLALAPDGALYGLTFGKDLIRIADGEVTGLALGLREVVTDVYFKEADVVGPGHLGPATALAVTPDGAVWVGGRDPGFILASDDHGYLFRHANGSSERVRPLGDDIDPYVVDLAVGPDGELWALMRSEDDSHLGRYDGQTWSVHSIDDGLPAVTAAYGERVAVGADGRVGLTIWGALDDEWPEGAGLAVFDGQGFTRYLVGKSVNDLAIAPDGSVWTSTDKGLYVIRPEAMAATE